MVIYELPAAIEAAQWTINVGCASVECVDRACNAVQRLREMALYRGLLVALPSVMSWWEYAMALRLES